MKIKGVPTYVLVLLLIIVTFGVYINSLSGDFLVDDEQGILNNENIHDAGIYFSRHFRIKVGTLLEA